MTIAEEGDFVELGLPDGPLDEEEEIDPFMSKVGGSPAWLFPPNQKEFLCELCHSPLYFVLQMDCPSSLNISSSNEKELLWERVFYIFICNSRECTEATAEKNRGAIKAFFQCRLSTADGHRERPFWEEDEEYSDESTTFASTTQTNQQANDLTHSMTALQISTKPSSSLPSVKLACFRPSLAMRIVDELIKSRPKPVRAAKLEASSSKDDSSWMGEAYESCSLDKSFRAFSDRIAPYPRQLVRYHSTRANSPPPTMPLSFHSRPWQPIPPCKHCGRERKFELQLMPAILSYLPLNEESYLAHIPSSRRNLHPVYGDGMEWGTILLFSCGSCLFKQVGEFTVDCHVVVQTEQDLS